jgi:hypothetical protein
MIRALITLVRGLGWRNTWRVLRIMRAQQKQGEPFGHLPPPEDERERQSREQIGPAILLYKAIRCVAPNEARLVTQRIIVADGIRFLRKTLGRISPTQMAALPPGDREEFAQIRGERFFNATIQWNHIESDRVQFTVTGCRFPPLCKAAGVSEIAPLFCLVDERYFGTVEENVILERPFTIAEGAKTCPFTLRIAPQDPSEERSAETD